MPRHASMAVLLLTALSVAAPAAQHKDTVIYSRFDVDPGEWRYFEFPSKDPEARLEVSFEVENGNRERAVRVRVLQDHQFARFRQNEPAEAIGASPYRRRGGLATRVLAGNYVVLVESRQGNSAPSRVQLDVSLLGGPDPETLPVAYAS